MLYLECRGEQCSPAGRCKHRPLRMAGQPDFTTGGYRIRPYGKHSVHGIAFHRVGTHSICVRGSCAAAHCHGRTLFAPTAVRSRTQKSPLPYTGERACALLITNSNTQSCSPGRRSFCPPCTRGSCGHHSSGSRAGRGGQRCWPRDTRRTCPLWRR